MARVKASGFSQGVTRKVYKQTWEATHVPGAHFDKVAHPRMPTSSGVRQRNDYGKTPAVAPDTSMYDENQITDLDYPGKNGKAMKAAKPPKLGKF